MTSLNPGSAACPLIASCRRARPHKMLSVFALAPSYVPVGPCVQPSQLVARRTPPRCRGPDGRLSTHAGTTRGSPPPPPRPPPSFYALVRLPVHAATTSCNNRSPLPPPAQWQAGGHERATVSCWLDEAASEEASKDVWVCVHTHPCSTTRTTTRCRTRRTRVRRTSGGGSPLLVSALYGVRA